MEIFGLAFTAKDIWFFGIAGTLTLTWIGFHLTNAINQKNRFHQAASTFMSRVLAELKGIYPVTQGDSERCRVYTLTKNVPTSRLHTAPPGKPTG